MNPFSSENCSFCTLNMQFQVNPLTWYKVTFFMFDMVDTGSVVIKEPWSSAIFFRNLQSPVIELTKLYNVYYLVSPSKLYDCTEHIVDLQCVISFSCTKVIFHKMRRKLCEIRFTMRRKITHFTMLRKWKWNCPQVTNLYIWSLPVL